MANRAPAPRALSRFFFFFLAHHNSVNSTQTKRKCAAAVCRAHAATTVAMAPLHAKTAAALTGKRDARFQFRRLFFFCFFVTAEALALRFLGSPFAVGGSLLRFHTRGSFATPFGPIRLLCNNIVSALLSLFFFLKEVSRVSHAGLKRRAEKSTLLVTGNINLVKCFHCVMNLSFVSCRCRRIGEEHDRQADEVSRRGYARRTHRAIETARRQRLDTKRRRAPGALFI